MAQALPGSLSAYLLPDGSMRAVVFMDNNFALRGFEFAEIDSEERYQFLTFINSQHDTQVNSNSDHVTTSPSDDSIIGTLGTYNFPVQTTVEIVCRVRSRKPNSI